MPPSATARNYERKELDVNLALVLAIASGMTVGIYVLLVPARESYLGILLYERGFTQYVVVFLACLVIVLSALKYYKLSKEARILRQSWFPDTVSFSEPSSPQLLNLQKNLALSKSVIAIRCSRIIAAYRHSGSRQTAADLALDDSSFYLSASESSYTLPRVLVGMIPILGFIGTVIGITQAVTGFSSFLEEAGEIEQIRAGISTVTSGLATAFDTTLLALLLSVLVTIPLAIVERLESRLLLSIDIYINDQILPRLKVKSDEDTATAATVHQAVSEAVQEHFPAPEALIEPAREYAQQAARELAASFVAEIGKVQEVSATLLEQMSQANQQSWQDRQEFMGALATQQQTTKDLVLDVQSIMNEVKASYASISIELTGQSEQIGAQLEKAANALETRIAALEASTARVGEFAQLQQNLEQSLRSLEQAAQLEHVLVEVRSSLAQLKPVLEQLSKPRRIMLMEDER
ncbi:MAG: MotA/TolQ/ExbB proton channel family protein [Cyanophyceae cyanobacterium]